MAEEQKLFSLTSELKETEQLSGSLSLLEVLLRDNGIEALRTEDKFHQLQMRFREALDDVVRFDYQLRNLTGDASEAAQELETLRLEVEKLNSALLAGVISLDQYARKLRELSPVSIGNHGVGIAGTLSPAGAPGNFGAPIAPISGGGYGGGHFVGGGVPSGGGGATAGKTGSSQPTTHKVYDKEITKGKEDPDKADQKLSDITDGVMERGKKAYEKAAETKGGFKAKAKAAVKGFINYEKPEEAVGKIGKLLKPLKTIKAVTKAVPFLGEALTAVDVGENLVKPWFSSKEDNEAAYKDNQESLADAAVKIKGMSNWNPIKWGWGLSLGISAVTDSAMHALGGTSAGAQDYIQTYKDFMSTGSADQLKQKLKDDLKYEPEDRKDKVKITERTVTDPPATDASKDKKDGTQQNAAQPQQQPPVVYVNNTLDLNGDGIRNDTDKTSWNQVTSYDEGQQMLSLVGQKMQRAMGLNQSNMEINKDSLLLKGVRDDSQQMRDVMQQYYQQNISALNTAISGARERQSHLGKDTDAFRGEEEYITGLQAQIMDTRVQMMMNQQSALDEVMNRTNDKQHMISNEWETKINNAIADGATQDSAYVLQYRKQEVTQENQNIDTSIAKIQDLINKNKDNAAYEDKLKMSLSDLQLQKATNSAQLRMMMEQAGSTFNLPDGMQPMTMFDAMNTNSLGSVVSITSGDLHMSVSINNMTGQQDDIQRVSSQIASAVQQIHRSMTLELSQQVLTGLGTR